MGESSLVPNRSRWSRLCFGTATIGSGQLTSALALLAIACLTACREKPQPSPPTSNYVNPTLCASCHPNIAKTYSLTGMGRSFFRPRTENVVEDYETRHTLHHPASDRTYTMIARDGRWFQRRHQIGFDGSETNVVETQIDYVIGSGNHARSYLHRTAEGKLVELPVTWYSEKNGYWAMSPGYDRPDHSDFRRAISYECMFCHNGYPSAVGTDGIFVGDIPEGIDCQRCHGPGRAHVEAASSGHASLESIRRAIVNPARLSRERQLDVCMQCHLQTTSLRSPDSIRRYTRRPFSYQPGEPLQDYAVYFDYAGNADRFEIDHAAYRLSKSRCFERSQMTCTTCHDPHQASRGQQAVARYEGICRNCHNSAHAMRGKNCLDCHMPKRRTDDVVHVVVTDHYIQRRKPSSDLLAPREEIHQANVGAVTIYFPAPDAELYLGVAEVQYPEVLRSAVERYRPAQPEFNFELGRAYVKSGQIENGIHWLEEALRIRADFSPALKELGAALSDSGQLARAAEVLERVPLDADALTDLGGVYMRQGKPDQAEQALQKAIAINPDIPVAYNLLGLQRSRKGDHSGAEANFRRAIRIQPDLSAAQSNLGNLLAGAGDLRQAIFHFRKAIAADPGNVDAHYNLGQAFAASGSFDEALREFRLAIQLDPDSYPSHFALGRILVGKRDPREAKIHFEKAAHSPDPELRNAANAAILSLR
jgi:predicted CXXCH cytochrome family protein